MSTSQDSSSETPGTPGIPLPATQLFGHRIQRSDTHRMLIVDGFLVPFTPTEYALVVPILTQAGTSMPSVPYAALARSVFGRELDLDTRRLLEKHVLNIRAKLRPHGLYVRGVAGYGYMLTGDVAP